MEKKKYIILTAVFAVLICGIGLLHAVLPDAEISSSERRKLMQLPEFTWEGIFSGDYMEDLEEYLLDQFPARDEFRSVKSMLRFYLFRQMDNNDIYLSGDSVLKMEYPLKENQVSYGVNKLNEVYEKYLKGMNVYYSVIPDKNYFAADETGHLSMDYDRLMEMMKDGVENMEYIDIFPLLTLEDYYRTDSHWKQENIHDVAKALAEAMGAGEGFLDYDEYTANVLEPFYGVYCGQSALPVKPDNITYMTSPVTETSKVTGAEFQGEKPVYDLEKFTGMDAYDVYLSGAQALLTIECPDAKSDKELIIFRDSYGSSITPYLLGAYAKVTMVDLRYMNSAFLESFVEFNDQDVLFLYSTTILNSAMLLK